MSDAGDQIELAIIGARGAADRERVRAPGLTLIVHGRSISDPD